MDKKMKKLFLIFYPIIFITVLKTSLHADVSKIATLPQKEGSLPLEPEPASANKKNQQGKKKITKNVITNDVKKIKEILDDFKNINFDDLDFQSFFIEEE
jgi:hypothetical protein